jgi:hypothetical protein
VITRPVRLRGSHRSQAKKKTSAMRCGLTKTSLTKEMLEMVPSAKLVSQVTQTGAHAVRRAAAPVLARQRGGAASRTATTTNRRRGTGSAWALEFLDNRVWNGVRGWAGPQPRNSGLLEERHSPMSSRTISEGPHFSRSNDGLAILRLVVEELR